MMKDFSAMMAVVVVIICAISATVIYDRANPVIPKYSCTAGPDEVCASDQFYYDYKHFEQLKADLAKRQMGKEVKAFQDEIDQAAGLAKRLSDQIPRGYQWNDGKTRFVKIPTVPAPTTLPGPVPTPGPADAPSERK